jgi:hypothetical protein
MKNIVTKYMESIDLFENLSLLFPELENIEDVYTEPPVPEWSSQNMCKYERFVKEQNFKCVIYNLLRAHHNMKPSPIIPVYKDQKEIGFYMKSGDYLAELYVFHTHGLNLQKETAYLHPHLKGTLYSTYESKAKELLLHYFVFRGGAFIYDDGLPLYDIKDNLQDANVRISSYKSKKRRRKQE